MPYTFPTASTPEQQEALDALYATCTAYQEVCQSVGVQPAKEQDAFQAMLRAADRAEALGLKVIV